MLPRASRLERYGYFIAAGCIIAATALFLPGREYFAKGQWALVYLLIIGLVAGISGVRAALAAAILAFLAWNYFFLPPYNSLRIEDPKDWLALFVFLLVGMAMGVQTGRMHDREAKALAREREAAMLNRLSASLVSITETRTMAETLLKEIINIAGAREAALWLPDMEGAPALFRRMAPADYAADPNAPAFAGWAFRQIKAIGLPPIPQPAEMQDGGLAGIRCP